MKFNPLVLIALSIIVSSCSKTIEQGPRDYPESIQNLDLQSDGAGQQFLDYIWEVDDSIAVLNYTNFMSGSDVIIEDEKKELNDLAIILETYEEYSISLEGHTVSQGGIEPNLILSENRATSVMSYLLTRGIPQERMTAKGYGEERPRASNNTAAGRILNRRVEIAISN